VSGDRSQGWEQEVLLALEEAPLGRIVFDADYTLWRDDIGYRAWAHALSHELLREEAVEPISAELQGVGAPPRLEPHADAAQLMELYRMGAVTDEALIEVMVSCFAGWTESELKELGSCLARDTLSDQVYDGIRELLEQLRRRGHSLFLISASAEWLVAGAIEALGLEFDGVYGVRVRLDGERLTGRMERPVPYHAGKAELWAARFDAPPVAAFSDSASDEALLALGSHLAGAVNPAPGLSKIVEERGEPWRVFMPSQTVAGHPVAARRGDVTL